MAPTFMRQGENLLIRSGIKRSIDSLFHSFGILSSFKCGSLRSFSLSTASLDPFHAASVVASTSGGISNLDTGSGKNAELASLADLRLQYSKQLSQLRKKYGAELGEKRRQEQMAEEAERSLILQQKEKKKILKQEQSQARALEVHAESTALQAFLKEDRATKAAHRARVEGKHGYIKFKRREVIKRQSSMWIEEKDLERRILDALANPYHLAGSYGSDPINRDDSYFEAEDS